MTDTALESRRLLDGRYELQELIGQGTFGRVYRGRDRRLARAVAVKVIKPWWTEDAQWAERFEREAQLMARVNDPGIVQIYDIGHAEEGAYYVAELVEGESLADRLRRGPMSPGEALDVSVQLCRALDQAHQQRVVHRDVKPGNVLIGRSGRVKVGDFGVARLAEGTNDGAAGTVLGTPRYMAPEQARGHTPTPATDVYGAGVVLYEMLAGRPPFVERSAVELALRHVGDPPPPLPIRTPPALAEIVDRALAKDPGSRYASAGEMADALETARGAIAGGAAPARAVPLPVLAPDEGRSAVPVRGDGGSVDPAPHASASVDPTRAATPSAASPSAASRSEGAQLIADTRVAPRRSPRRNVNPGEARRYRALLALVLLILGALIAGAVLTSGGSATVPSLTGLTRAAAGSKLRRLGLQPSFTGHYASAVAGTVIAQQPGAGTRVGDGGTVRVTVSRGPRPVVVPQLAGERSADAQAVLSRLGLAVTVNPVPAPGVSPGLVVQQIPAATTVAAHSHVTLIVAETPRWRALASFSGNGAGNSGPFRIRGSRWRIVYGMGYDGTCTFIFFCSGPSAQVTNATTGSGVKQFDLGEGSGQTQVLSSGPGTYTIGVTPGSDSAHWTLEVQDYY